MRSNRIYIGDKGFSLIEVIIAVGIVSFAFVGIMAVFASNIRVEIANRDRITAAYLAQEGLEVTRQLRDGIWFNGGDMSTDFPTGNNKTLSLNDVLDITQGWHLANAGENYKRKIYLTDNGVYIQSDDPAYAAGHPASWKETTFTRQISIVKETDYKFKITVNVNYGSGGKKVEVVSYLYDDWYK